MIVFKIRFDRPADEREREKIIDEKDILTLSIAINEKMTGKGKKISSSQFCQTIKIAKEILEFSEDYIIRNIIITKNLQWRDGGSNTDLFEKPFFNNNKVILCYNTLEF